MPRCGRFLILSGELGLTRRCVRSLCCERHKFKESGLDQRMALDQQPSAGKDRRQHHGDSRARLSGLEGHPVFPVVPGVQCMASLSSSIRRQLRANGDWMSGPLACKRFMG